MRKLLAAGAVLFLLFLSALAAWVWPTRYHYEHVGLFSEARSLVRIDRFSGVVEVLSASSGWRVIDGDGIARVPSSETTITNEEMRWLERRESRGK